MQPAPGKLSTLKPTLETLFHIDYDWWSRSGKDLRQYQIAQLPASLRDQVAQHANGALIDYVDPVTAEVTQLDDLSLALRAAAADPTFITPQTAIIDGIFRIFVENGNQPQTPVQLGERLDRPAQTILRMLSGSEIYAGIRRVR